jgi:hypothetical protein
VISAVNKSPLAALVIAAAETLDMFSTKDDAANLFTTATKNVSIPARLPWLSNAGVVTSTLKFAKGARVVWSLLLGTMYGSEGVMTTLFARSVAGGKLNVDQTPAFAKSVANVPLSVVIAAGISLPMN